MRRPSTIRTFSTLIFSNFPFSSIKTFILGNLSLFILRISLKIIFSIFFLNTKFPESPPTKDSERDFLPSHLYFFFSPTSNSACLSPALTKAFFWCPLKSFLSSFLKSLSKFLNSSLTCLEVFSLSNLSLISLKPTIVSLKPLAISSVSADLTIRSNIPASISLVLSRPS